MLYIIATPIGNLEDLTLRALRLLKTVDLIACEDTRTSGKLLAHYDIPTPRTSYHAHNEQKKTPRLIAQMQAGTTIALITDAGTPGLSDPGFYLVRACLAHDIPVEAIPGPSAFLTALVASGLPSDRFIFEGFLPPKKGRMKRLTALTEEERTMIFYESPHRLVKALTQMQDVFGPDRPAVVARELTKKFESFERGTLADLASFFAEQPRIRGEFVLLIGGKKK